MRRFAGERQCALAGRDPGAQVEITFVGDQFAIPDVERRRRPTGERCAVGDVDNGLAGLRISITGLGVRQQPDFVERVQVGARQSKGSPSSKLPRNPMCPLDKANGIRTGPAGPVENWSRTCRFDGKASSVIIARSCPTAARRDRLPHVGAMAAQLERPERPARRLMPITTAKLPARPAAHLAGVLPNTAATSG